MDLEGRSLRERLLQSLVVFVVLFAYGYVQEAFGWRVPVIVAALFFVILMAIDGTRNRLDD